MRIRVHPDHRSRYWSQVFQTTVLGRLRLQGMAESSAVSEQDPQDGSVTTSVPDRAGRGSTAEDKLDTRHTRSARSESGYNTCRLTARNSTGHADRPATDRGPPAWEGVGVQGGTSRRRSRGVARSATFHRRRVQRPRRRRRHVRDPVVHHLADRHLTRNA